MGKAAVLLFLYFVAFCLCEQATETFHRRLYDDFMKEPNAEQSYFISLTEFLEFPAAVCSLFDNEVRY